MTPSLSSMVISDLGMFHFISVFMTPGLMQMLVSLHTRPRWMFFWQASINSISEEYWCLFENKDYQGEKNGIYRLTETFILARSHGQKTHNQKAKGSIPASAVNWIKNQGKGWEFKPKAEGTYFSTGRKLDMFLCDWQFGFVSDNFLQ